MKEIVVENLADFEKKVEEIFTEIINYCQVDKAVVVALSGNLGAGKTTFVQMLAKKLGIKEKVTSPTFTIFKVYEINDQENFSRLIHMDAYRIEDLSELKPLRFFELLEDKSNLLCIEWSEKIISALPKNIIKIHIEILDGGQRKIIWGWFIFKMVYCLAQVGTKAIVPPNFASTFFKVEVFLYTKIQKTVYLEGEKY